ncbi:hypothetical protein G3H63_15555 [Microbacterium resistens]|uniref:hypothetical protein n=1 Tax=Microbacterium resistens TaxID=156977 RepID=UPI001C58E826|nr:hypothetical protein [Microbacterium resistens]MBW1640480.1 hypothetical protein [Microbacterium resistens]
MADVQFRIDSAAGSLPLVSTPFEWGPYRLGAGTTGLGLAPELTRIVPSPAGGGTIRGSRPGIRKGTLQITMEGSSRGHTQELIDALALALKIRNRPELVAVVPDQGTWRLPFVRVGGGEPAYDNGGDELLTWDIEVECPGTFWIRDEPVEFTVKQIAEGMVGLLPDLAKLQVAPSAAIGAIEAANPGTEEVPIHWRITGPGGPATVLIGGRGFTLSSVLTAGQFVTVTRTEQGWRVTDQAGASKYSALGAAPKFPMAPPGAIEGVAALSNATSAAASIAGWFNPAREVIH